MADCIGLLGLDEDELGSRLGEATSRRAAAGDVWLVYVSDRLSLRVRCARRAPGERPRVASWTASFARGHETLSDAARSVGLWPLAAPDQEARTVRAPLIRRPLPCPASGDVLSLTATVRNGRITQISVFDEPPDWI
ncbi:MAG: hypothetical protein R6X22_05955 [Gemmatimonadota bacterium]|jgi:hypothetical protein